MEKSGIQVIATSIEGPPAAKIIEMTKKSSFDLILMGTRGLGSFASALLGSVSNYVVHHAPCPVWLVPFSPKEDFL